MSDLGGDKTSGGYSIQYQILKDSEEGSNNQVTIRGTFIYSENIRVENLTVFKFPPNYLSQKGI